MRKNIAFILPMLSGVLWGTAGLFIRVIQEFGFNNVTVVSSKMILTAILLFVGLFVTNRELLKIKLKDLWLFLAAGLVGILLLNLGYNAAIENLTLSLAAVLLSLSPVFVMILANIFFKEQITFKKIICTFFAVVGCTLVSGILEGNITGKSSLMGIILGLFAALFYACYGMFSKALMEKEYNAFTVIFYSTLAVAVVLLPFTDWEIIGEFIKVAPVQNTAFMVAYSVGTAILPYLFYTFAMAYIDAGIVAILGAGGEPSAAMVFGCIFYREIPSAWSVLGLMITIIALTFICLPDNKQTVHGIS